MIIIVDPEGQKLIMSLCDAALRGRGLEMFNIVQKVATSMRPASAKENAPEEEAEDSEKPVDTEIEK